jgi:hypothetical protein
VTLVNPEQLLKRLSLKVTILDGMLILVKLKHNSKQPLPIDVTVDGITKFVKPVKEKHPFPNDLTVDGIFKFFNNPQLENKAPLSVFNVFGSIIFVKFEQLLNPYIPMLVIEFGNVIDGKEVQFEKL